MKNRTSNPPTEPFRHPLVLGRTGARMGFVIQEPLGSAKGDGVFGPIIASSKFPIVYQDAKGQRPGIGDLRKRSGVGPIRWGGAAQDGWLSMRWNPLEECRRDPRSGDAFEALIGCSTAPEAVQLPNDQAAQGDRTV